MVVLFARSGSSAVEHDSNVRFGEPDEWIGLQVELSKLRDQVLDVAHYDTHDSALLKAINPKSAPYYVL